VNDKKLRDQFFCRPHCIADVWFILKKNYINVFQDPLFLFRDSLVEVLAHDSCNFEWCVREGLKKDDHYDRFFEDVVREMNEVLQFVEAENKKAHKTYCL
jgi:hypothetical protein